jgi:hypothetical protein
MDIIAFQMVGYLPRAPIYESQNKVASGQNADFHPFFGSIHSFTIAKSQIDAGSGPKA